MKSILLFAVAVLLLGCKSTPTNSADPEPRYAGGVSVALLDRTPREPTMKLEIVRDSNLPPNARIIARLSRPGAASKEAAMIDALAWRARQLGANGIIPVIPNAPTGRNQVKVNVNVGQPWWWNNDKQSDPVFVVDAFVYETDKPNTP